MELKKCCRCKEIKNIDGFSKKQRACKQCYRKYYLKKTQRKCLECKSMVTGQRHVYCSNECKIIHNCEKIPGGCWNWKGKTLLDGYVRTRDLREKNKSILIHRLSYELFKGDIPEGMLVCHTCDNRKCTNPKHLWLGTHHDNNQDCLKKRRNSNGGQKGKNHYAAKLNEENVLEIKRKLRIGELQKNLAREYGVCNSCINAIAKNLTWRHVNLQE